MAPERSPKRQKVADDSSQITASSQPAPVPLPPDTRDSGNLTSTDNSQRQTSRASWFNSWPRKAPPLTEIVHESLRSASNAACEVIPRAPSSKPKSARSPSLAMTLGKKQSSRALPADATTTVVHATSDVRSPSSRGPMKTQQTDAANEMTTKEDSVVPSNTNKDNSAKTDESLSKPPPPKNEPFKTVHDVAQGSRSSWLGWLGSGVQDSPGSGDGSASVSSKAIEDKQPQTTSAQSGTHSSQKLVLEESSTKNTQANFARRSWLPWYGDGEGSIQVDTSDERTISKNRDGKVDASPTKIVPAAADNSKRLSVETSPPPPLSQDGVRPSGWAFWSRDRKATDSTASVDKAYEGELAISDTPSQLKPKRASISLPKSEKNKTDLPKSDTKAENLAAKLGSSPGIDSPEPSGAKSSKAESSNATVIVREPITDIRPASIKSNKLYQNLLLPELHNTLKLPENPSVIQQLARLLRITKEPGLQHLSLIPEPPRIKNALAIGVHGFFPAPLLRTVLGQPTGTSIKFAEMAAKSVRRWTTARGYECKVKTAALEGEGKIAERIELLWKLLLNWIEEIRATDFLLIACHSQGVPVAIMLVAKLIQFGCVSSANVGICAMAGVNMGPFSEYRSRWISGSAGELFEFSDPTSQVSNDYRAALDSILKHGVHVTFVGSIDDQLVSLESSTFSSISHPHIYRAVSIDAKVHAPNFLSHLVGFALKLRNLGIQDHGLIKELSSPLAGSLYTGEGHSRIYEDDAVYDLAVAFTMETNSMVGMHTSQRSSAPGGANPYILPFAMRGILEEDFVRNELQGEASILLQQFDDWKPTTKVLKDVKFRLEGIRSKL